MERNIQKIGITNWVMLLLAGVVGAILARYAGTMAGLVGVTFLGLGFLVAAVSNFQMRLVERERLEKLEYDELKKTKNASTLFTEEADTFPALRSREQFDKYLVPAFTVLLFILQGGAAWWFWRWLDKSTPPVLDRAPIAMALYALLFLILFLLGKYSAGLARLDDQRLLRPGAGYLMLGSVVCLIAAATEGVAYSGFPGVDLRVAQGLCIVLGLAAVETLFTLTFEIYRPRVKGQKARLLYESRLIGLLGQPGGLITTAAQALDYQFGFKVSETWFYRFMEKALAWIILLQVALLFLSTAFVIIEPDEEGVIEHFGRPAAGAAVLEPGFHFKWPWPVDTVYRYPTREIRDFTVGVISDPELDKERTVLWTRPHYKKEFNMIVASREGMPPSTTPAGEKPVPANLLTVSIPIQYQVTNVLAWAYNHADSAQLLEDLANREVVRYLVNVDMDHVMSDGRLTAAGEIRRRVQDNANKFALGVNIIFVGLQDIHPPIGNKQLQVAAAFEEVVAAVHRKETNILYALAYQAQKIPQTQAEATNLIAGAENARLLQVVEAAADASRFTNQVAAYDASPSVYMQRTYLDTLAQAIAPVRKYVLAVTNTHDVITLNLEEKIRSDLLNNLVLPPGANPASTNK